MMLEISLLFSSSKHNVLVFRTVYFSMKLTFIVEISMLFLSIQCSGIYDRMTNSGPIDMDTVMFPSSSECFQFNVTVKTDEEYLQI